MVVSEVLRGEVSDIVYKVWLDDLEPIGFDGSTVTLSTVEFKRKIIEQKFSAVLHDAFEKALGFAVEVRLVTAENPAHVPTIDEVEKSFHEENTFQTFVVGSSNKFAHAAAQAVAALEKAGAKYHDALRKLGMEPGAQNIVTPAKELQRLVNATVRRRASSLLQE